MVDLNHFAIAAGLGATLGPHLKFDHGQIGSSELAAKINLLSRQRKRPSANLDRHNCPDNEYETTLTRAFVVVRQEFSADRVLADPAINSEFIKACHDLGLDDTAFNLNLALIGLRKRNKLKVSSKMSVDHDQWRYSAASEIAARVTYYQHQCSIDTMLSHPEFVQKFDKLARSITPGYSSFQYRWAALNVRKKGASAKIKPGDVDALEWSDRVRFDAAAKIPAEEGVYTLFERDTCLFVAGSEDIRQSVESQQTLTQADLFESDLWRPKAERLAWQYVQLPDSNSDYRFGIVRSLVGRWEPVFNIPRGKKAA